MKICSSMWNQTLSTPYSQNGMIITPREYSTVRLGVESGSSYRSIESSTIRGPLVHTKCALPSTQGFWSHTIAFREKPISIFIFKLTHCSCEKCLMSGLTLFELNMSENVVCELAVEDYNDFNLALFLQKAIDP